LPQAQLIIRKGFHPQVDSYSAFMEADRTTTTGLAAYLQARGLRKAYVCGLATDFCVAWTALDARAAGFEAVVIEDACRAIDLNGSLAQAWKDLQAAGVQRLQTTDLK
jgi:nicotinamidase/pyrazinamidase